MADIPNPRSYAQILGAMLDAFFANVPVRNIKPGSPVLSFLEAAAQSDMRSVQDLFDHLNATSLERATGLALERIGADEEVYKLAAAPSNGDVTVSDSRYEKVATKIYQGKPAPIIGSTTLYVNDATDFPATGELYIGRGTLNYEGPLAYTAVSQTGLYWTITLAGGSATTRYHNLAETVILAQGGNRSIPAGTLVQTPQGNSSNAVQFATMFAATIPDGEVELEGVLVACQSSGEIGNVAAGAINAFVTAPFTGATVTNPLPFGNGNEAEDEEAFRERIKAARQSRSRGTALAIQSAVFGLTSTDENKRITSATVVTRTGFPTTLYIDDGTGYEEKTQGVALESLTDLAQGGEQYFQLAAGRPVSKSFVTTSISAPFSLSAGAKLRVNVGGVPYEHTFDSDEFRSIDGASAHEVVASINGNSSIEFSARTAASGTKVSIFAKTDTDEDIEVLEVDEEDIDANLVLGFPYGRVDTLLLYKNDRLLSKDGKLASVVTTNQALWETMTEPQTLTISVDGTAATTYEFTDADFVAAGADATTLSETNSLEDWALVFNAVIPGITAEATGDEITITSNVGRKARASLTITGGSLVTDGNMFETLEAEGADNDYSLDRNTGQLRLEDALEEDDRLSAGTLNTRAFIESTDELGTFDLADDAKLWFVVDGEAEIVPTGISASIPLNVAVQASPAWGVRVRITAATSAAIFTQVQRGDWVILWDTAFNATNIGQWRVADCDDTFIDIERSALANAETNLALEINGFTVVRTEAQVKEVTVPADTNYTASSIVDILNDELEGATASVYRTNRMRVATDTYGIGGDIALVAMTSDADALKLQTTDAIENLNSHNAVIESGNKENGTPGFQNDAVASSVALDDMTVVTALATTGIFSNTHVVAAKSLPDSTVLTRFGSNAGTHAMVSARSGLNVDLRVAAPVEWIAQDRIYAANPYSITPECDLVVVVDGDVASKRFAVPMYRNITPVDVSYSASPYFEDEDASSTLSLSFGTDFDFKDFAVHMHARTKTSLSAGANTTATVLYRYYRFGPDGNTARLRYVMPTEASADLDVSVDSLSTGFNDISVKLASGAARTENFRAFSKIGVCSALSGGLYTATYVWGYEAATYSITSNVLSLVLTLPSGVTDHGITTGDSMYVSLPTLGIDGMKTVTDVNATTISFAFTAANVGSTAISGSVVYNDIPSDITVTSLAVGDVATFGTDVQLAGTGYNTTIVVAAKGNHYVQGKIEANPGVVAATPTFTTIESADGIAFYPLSGNTATAIASAVNAIEDCIVSAVAIGTGGVSTGTVTVPSFETLGADTWYSLTDGVNYVGTTNTPADVTDDFQFNFKDAIAATLVTEADWQNEEVRLVPITAKNLVDYLNSSAVGGLFANADIEVSTRSSNLQIASTTTGSEGSVQVQGGLANSASATILGAARLTDNSSFARTQINLADTPGFMAGMYVALDNANRMPKTLFTTASNVTVLGTNGMFLRTAGPNFWDYSNTGAAAVDGHLWQIEKQGNFLAFVSTGLGTALHSANSLGGVEEGDWVIIEPANTLTVAIGGLVRSADEVTVTFTSHGLAVGDDFYLYPGEEEFAAGTYVITATPTANTFTFDSEGENASSEERQFVRAQAVSSLNQGTFRVVRVTNGTGVGQRCFWIENSLGVEETARARLSFLNFDSVMPGDSLTISTDAWGEDNQGEWEIESIGQTNFTGAIGEMVRAGSTVTVTHTNHGLATGDYVTVSPGELDFPDGEFQVTVTNANVFTYTQAGSATSNASAQTFQGRILQNKSLMKVYVNDGPTTAGTGSALGSGSELVQLIEAEEGRMIKKIHSISINNESALQADIKFTTTQSYTKISPVVGTVMTALDKLDFPTTIAQGVDGYSYSTGLIGEANRVLYGDANDTATYPGVVAAGANVQISGPLIKRVEVSLKLRISGGVSSNSIIGAVRSAVAAAINKVRIGKSIALSDVVTAAQGVNGVVSVAITSPAYDENNDLISVQPFEKALVRNLEEDILVSLVGE